MLQQKILNVRTDSEGCLERLRKTVIGVREWLQILKRCFRF